MSGRRYGKKTPASRTIDHASTAASMKITSWKNVVQASMPTNVIPPASESAFPGSGDCVRSWTVPVTAGRARSGEQATGGRFGYRIDVGSHSEVQPTKPRANKCVSTTDLDPRPVSSVGNGVTGVLAPSTPLRFE